jgi:glycolate oxidase iron-sulfur subunit
VEICELLDRRSLLSGLELLPLPRWVLVHEPCSHRNLLGGNAAVHRLLSRIPGLEVDALTGNSRCCGAAGTYMIQQPAMAESLLADKSKAIARAAPDIVVTTNAGCALHLAAGIREAGLRVEVCHPVELIARQIRDPSPER